MRVKSILLGLSLVTAGLIVTGCGSSDSSDSTTSATSTSVVSGQLADSYVANADFECADGTVGITDVNGTFECKELPVKFKLGGLKLGEIKVLPKDKHVFPQDLVGVSRDDVNNSDVVAIAQFLQACDEDNNPENGIQIKNEVKVELQNKNEVANAQTVEAIAEDTNLTLVERETAKKHLEHTTKFVKNVHENLKEIPTKVQDVILTPASTLTQEAKDTLSYMGNEERLAHDVYLELYNYHLDKGTEIRQLSNIAQNSEKTHIETVQALINKYITDPSEFSNIDKEELGYKDKTVEEMQMGTYDIQAIQDLHDALLEMGKESKEAALKVGCMVEVTDINDLEEKIKIATDSNASDLVEAFTFLENGSYNHYWAFDKGLKNMGITEGCCSIGEVNGVNYCHNEYPQNENGQNNNQSGNSDHNVGKKYRNLTIDENTTVSSNF
jgi:hypothetical protein